MHYVLKRLGMAVPSLFLANHLNASLLSKSSRILAVLTDYSYMYLLSTFLEKGTLHSITNFCFCQILFIEHSPPNLVGDFIFIIN